MRERSFVICCLLLFLCSCSQTHTDKEIEAKITTEAKEELTSTGAYLAVEDGVVTLTGSASSAKAKSEVEEKVKSVDGVKKVVNQIVVGPAIGEGKPSLKQSVDRILKKYPTVQAQVTDSVIVLQGTIDSKKAQKLFKSMQQLQAKEVVNELVISSE